MADGSPGAFTVPGAIGAVFRFRRVAYPVSAIGIVDAGSVFADLGVLAISADAPTAIWSAFIFTADRGIIAAHFVQANGHRSTWKAILMSNAGVFLADAFLVDMSVAVIIDVVTCFFCSGMYRRQTVVAICL